MTRSDPVIESQVEGGRHRRGRRRPRGRPGGGAVRCCGRRRGCRPPAARAGRRMLLPARAGSGCMPLRGRRVASLGRVCRLRGDRGDREPDDEFGALPGPVAGGLDRARRAAGRGCGRGPGRSPARRAIRARPWSPWANISKARRSISGVRPIPESRTRTTAWSPSRPMVIAIRPPGR